MIVFLMSILMATAEMFGFFILRKFLFRKKMKPNQAEQIPVLHTLSQKFAGKPNTYERVAISKTVQGARKLVNTTTFEHIVSGFISHDSEIRRSLANGGFGKDQLFDMIGLKR